MPYKHRRFPVLASDTLTTRLGLNIFFAILERCGKPVWGRGMPFAHDLIRFFLGLGSFLPDGSPVVDPGLRQTFRGLSFSHFCPEQTPRTRDNAVGVIASPSYRN